MNVVKKLFQKGFSHAALPLWGSILIGCFGGLFFYTLVSEEMTPEKPYLTTSSISVTETSEIKGEKGECSSVVQEDSVEKRSEEASPKESLPELPGLPPLAEEKRWEKREPSEIAEKKPFKEEVPQELSADFLEEVQRAEQILSQPLIGELQEAKPLPEVPQAMVAVRADWSEASHSQENSEGRQVHFEEPALPIFLETRERINRLPPPPVVEEIPVFDPDLLEKEDIPVFDPDLLEKGEMEEGEPISQIAPTSILPSRNADVLASESLRETVSLEARNTDLRLLFSQVETQTGLKIYASPEVQGKVSCKIESRESEEIFRRLLGTTPFTAWQEGELVYIGRRTELETLPKPLSLRGSRTFVPQHISLEQLQKTLEANLSPYGESSLINNSLRVQDLEVTLRDLEKIVALLDVQGKIPKWDIFVFQHNAPSRKHPLDLQKIAENRGLSLQKATAQWLFPEKLRKKEELPAHLFSISHRIDTFLIGLEDQKKVQLISDRSSDCDLELETPRQFPFSLKLGEKVENYVAEVTFSMPADTEVPLGALGVKVDCRPENEKTRGERWTFQTTIEMERGLLLQGFLTEYQAEREEKKPFQSFPGGKKTPVEIVLTLITRLEEPPRPETTFSSTAIKYLAKQQENIGCKIMETALGEERKWAQSFLHTSQRLRSLVYDVQLR